MVNVVVLNCCFSAIAMTTEFPSVCLSVCLPVCLLAGMLCIIQEQDSKAGAAQCLFASESAEMEPENKR